jgi:hypothetical protein
VIPAEAGWRVIWWHALPWQDGGGEEGADVVIWRIEPIVGFDEEDGDPLIFDDEAGKLGRWKRRWEAMWRESRRLVNEDPDYRGRVGYRVLRPGDAMGKGWLWSQTQKLEYVRPIVVTRREGEDERPASERGDARASGSVEG